MINSNNFPWYEFMKYIEHVFDLPAWCKQYEAYSGYMVMDGIKLLVPVFEVYIALGEFQTYVSYVM